MSAHFRRRGRHAVPRPPVMTTAGAGIAPAVMTAALTAGVAASGSVPALAAVPAAREARFPAVPNVTVYRHPPTPFGLPSWIDGYAPLQFQSRCSPSAKPGVVAFERMVLRAYPDTGSDGIVRACNVGGTSEHKEGRAWDWRVSAYDPHQAAEAAALLHWLLKPDAAGHSAAMARRLGVMYIIWDRHIWGAYYASSGWRRYGGPEGHTDHIHFSFDWRGAQKKTSFWHRMSWRPVSPAVVHRYGGGLLMPGARGPAVTAVQRALRVSTNGVFGPRTKAAVEAFQRGRGLGVDGIVGPQTWRALGVGYHRPVHRHVAHRPAVHIHGHTLRRPPAVGTWTRTHRWPTTTTMRHARRHLLEPGASHWPVSVLQRLVGVRPDGDFGPRTADAVRRYQTQHHLYADAVVGPRTWKALRRTATRVASNRTEHERAAVHRYLAAKAAARRQALLTRFGRTVLRTGAQGPAVRYVQRRIGIHVDGAYGPHTASAVIRFQRAHHLAADGVVGAATWRVLVH